MQRLPLPLALLLFACSDKGGGGGGAGGQDSGDGGAAADSGDSGVEEADPSLVCAELDLPVRPWVDAVDDDALYALAADLTVPTRDGDWNLATQYSGCDTYLFIQEQPYQNSGFDRGIWERDHDDLFDLLPRNVHLFFLPDSASEDSRVEALDELQDELESELGRMDEADADWWRGRIHYVTTRDTAQEGWLGDQMQSPGWGVAIDRFQRLRYIGSYADPKRWDDAVGWFEPNLGMVANEPIYFNYEAAREEALEADGAVVVAVFDGEQGGDTTVEVELPSPAELAEADTLVIDLTMGCIGEGEFGTCPAWDYMAYLYLCDLPLDDDNPHADTPCEAGSTLEGVCASPLGEERSGTYTCESDGSGYADLQCGSCDTEIARWITTYHREGRWVHDISPMLPLLAGGGTPRIRFQSDNSYELTASLRFSDSGKPARPAALEHVLGSENSDTFFVPETAAKVELATVISQHGQTCGEFCDAEHAFTINGASAEAVTRSFPTTSSYYGCMDQVGQGTVPNQYGTWWYGRSGWCPGMHVETVVADITDQVLRGAENTIDYAVDGDAGTVRKQVWIAVSE